MTGKSDNFYLLHIPEVIEQIEQYLKDYDLTSFLATSLVQDGVIRQTEIIG